MEFIFILPVTEGKPGEGYGKKPDYLPQENTENAKAYGIHTSHFFVFSAFFRG